MADMTIVDSVLKYLGIFHEKLKEANETAQWNDIEEDTHEQLSISDFETEAADLSGSVFSTTVAHIPAQIIALSSTYDETQAATRLSKVFATTRADYYRLSDEAMTLLNDRNSIRTSMLASVVNISEQARKEFTEK